MKKKKCVIEKDDAMIVSKVCAQQGVGTKCRTQGSAVCITCMEYQQMISIDQQWLKFVKDFEKRNNMAEDR